MNKASKVNESILQKQKQSIQIKKRNSREQKQYYHQEGYQISSRVLQIKNKYKQKYNADNTYTKQKYAMNGINSGRYKQNQIVRKLTNLKEQLQSMPNWENIAKNILFNDDTLKFQQNNQSFRRRQATSKVDKFQHNSAYKNKDPPQQVCSFNCSTVKVTKQSRKSSQKKQFQRQQFTSYTPSKESNISKYYLPKNRYKYQQITTNKLNQSANSTYLDHRINQIDQKIKQFEYKKKKLGVDFVPFSREISQKKKSNVTYDIKENKENKQNKQSKENKENKENKDIKQIKEHKEYKEYKQSNVRQHSTQTPNIYPLQPSKRYELNTTTLQNKKNPILNIKKQLQSPITTNKIISYEITSPRFAIIEKEQRLNKNMIGNQKYEKKNLQQLYPSNKIICQKTEEGIKQRKKKIYHQNQSKKKNNKQTFKLVNLFCQQVKLDQKLRNIKIWFKYCKNQKKLQKLKNLLKLQGFDYSLKRIQQQFEVQQKQDNPFFSVTSQDFDMQSVSKSYIQSQRHWKRNICKCFNRRVLEQQDLYNIALDLDKKGFIALEDLVRFLNMETGTFFRNRDLIAIFRRICGNNTKVGFKEFLNVLCG